MDTLPSKKTDFYFIFVDNQGIGLNSPAQNTHAHYILNSYMWITLDNPWITFTYINKFELSMADPPDPLQPPHCSRHEHPNHPGSRIPPEPHANGALSPPKLAELCPCTTRPSPCQVQKSNSAPRCLPMTSPPSYLRARMGWISVRSVHVRTRSMRCQLGSMRSSPAECRIPWSGTQQ